MPILPMNTGSPRADLSVDFLSWINTELRKYAREPEEFHDERAKNVGLVNRLRAYVAERIAPTV